MATKKAAGGFSLDPDDQVPGSSLFGPGHAVAKKHFFGWHDYNGKYAKVCALIVTLNREGEKQNEAFTVGAGFKPSSDGLTIIPTAGQTGIADNTKCGMYLAALRDDGGMPKGFVSDDISVLDGIEGELIQKPMGISDDRPKKKDADDKGGKVRKPVTCLVFSEVESAPWSRGASKKKKAAADDDEDDEDEAPKKKGKVVDEDEDEDEKPAKKAKGKKATADDDEEEDSDSDIDEDLLEEGIEALIELAGDGAIKKLKVEESLLAHLKKHPKKKAIAALMADPKVLKMERGWSFDGKTVSVDE